MASMKFNDRGVEETAVMDNSVALVAVAGTVHTEAVADSEVMAAGTVGEVEVVLVEAELLGAVALTTPKSLHWIRSPVPDGVCRQQLNYHFLLSRFEHRRRKGML